MSTVITPADALAAHLGRQRLAKGPLAGSGRWALLSRETAQSHSPVEPADFSGLEPQECHKGYSRWGIALFGVGGVLFACWLLDARVAHPAVVSTGSTAPVDGLTIFAVFFVAALAIER